MLERTCEAIAYCLLDLDLLEEQNLILRFGDLVVDFYDLTEQLSMLAMKTVLLKVMQMIAKGFLGLFRGEVINAQAGVRMLFTFSVVGGHYGNWDLRKRRAGDGGINMALNV